MYQQTYYVDERTGTFADPLLAYGLAVVLDGRFAGVREEVHGVVGEWFGE